MTTQPDALRLADWLEADACDLQTPRDAAAELRRLHEVTQENLDRIDQLNDIVKEQGIVIDIKAERITALGTANKELLEALKEIAHGLEGARIWGGMDWAYNPLHPFKYLPIRDKARAAIAKHGEQK